MFFSIFVILAVLMFVVNNYFVSCCPNLNFLKCVSVAWRLPAGYTAGCLRSIYLFFSSERLARFESDKVIGKLGMFIEADHSARQIARNFSKVMSGRKTSRILLNRFIHYVA